MASTQRGLRNNWINHRTLLVAAALVMATVAIPFTASASSTLVVDDDGVECPGAGYTDVQSAIDDATTGATVEICAGSYGGFDVSTSDVSVVAPSGDDVVVTGSVALSAEDTSLEGPQIEGTAATGDVVSVSADTVSISSVKVIGHENATSGAGIHASGVSHVVVEDSGIFSANESGIALVDVDQAIVGANTIENAGDDAILLEDTKDARVRDNEITLAGDNGIHVAGTSQDNSVENNFVSRPTQNGIRAGANTTSNSFTANRLTLQVDLFPVPSGTDTTYDEGIDAVDLSVAGLAPTAIQNTWTQNRCVLGQPATICAI